MTPEEIADFLLAFFAEAQRAGDPDPTVALRGAIIRQVRAYGAARATAERERCVNAVADVAVTWPPHSAEFNALLDAAAAIRALGT